MRSSSGRHFAPRPTLWIWSFVFVEKILRAIKKSIWYLPYHNRIGASVGVTLSAKFLGDSSSLSLWKSCSKWVTRFAGRLENIFIEGNSERDETIFHINFLKYCPMKPSSDLSEGRLWKWESRSYRMQVVEYDLDLSGGLMEVGLNSKMWECSFMNSQLAILNILFCSVSDSFQLAKSSLNMSISCRKSKNLLLRRWVLRHTGSSALEIVSIGDMASS